MDFFQTQSEKRRESLILLLGFAAVFAICFTLVHWLAEGISNIFTVFGDGEGEPIVKWGIFFAVLAVVIAGCYRRWQDVSGGGQKLAEHIGATKVSRQTANRDEKALLNMVEEISVAAGIKPPTSYILQPEASINAFVAGNEKNTILVVTQGALTHFNEDEMRAVVAHEVGHIANDDLAISMKLLIGLGGLNAITEAGYACFEDTQIKSSNKNESFLNMFEIEDAGFSHSSGFGIIQIVAGVVLVALGSVFTLFGDILKTAFSRKREFYADAKAVQFTRDPWAMASALNTISQNDGLRGVRLRYQGVIDHLCIDAPSSHLFFDKWLATHPPIEKRIATIDPHFDVKQRKKQERESGVSPGAANDHKKSGAARTSVAPNMVPGAMASTLSLTACGAQIAILISLMIEKSGYSGDANIAKYESTLKCYTSESFPMRNWAEPNINAELEAALDKLLELPAFQRQNLLDHLAELVEHDGIMLAEETEMLEHVYARLNPSDKAA